MGQAEVNIRPAGPEDLTAMVSLLKELFSIEQEFRIDPERQRCGLSRILASENARLLAARAEGDVIGMCAGQLVVSTSEGGYSLWAEDLVVRPAWRGRGVGGALMETLADWARGRGATRLQLLADQTNQTGMRFHQGLGCQVTRMICMRKALE